LGTIQAIGGFELLYSFSLNDLGSALNPVEGFPLNGADPRALEFSPHQPVGRDAPGTIRPWRQPFVLFHGGGGAERQFGCKSVPSGGSLSAPGSAVAFTRPGCWAVSDAPQAAITGARGECDPYVLRVPFCLGMGRYNRSIALLCVELAAVCRDRAAGKRYLNTQPKSLSGRIGQKYGTPSSRGSRFLLARFSRVGNDNRSSCCLAMEG